VGHFATGVVVVTAMGEDGPLGFTCQSFGSLSLDPILVSFSARSASNSWPGIRDSGLLAVNVLSAQQEAVARVFAESALDKFEGISWSHGGNGAPLLDGALARLEGRLVETATYGDHDIAIVAVDRGETLDGAPLLYYRGGFGTFTS